MKITKDALAAKLAEWVRTTLVSQAASPIAKFKLGFASTQIAPAVHSLIDSVAAMGSPVVDGAGNVDVEGLRSAVMSGFEAAGGISLAGFKFEAADADAFFETISH